MDHLDAKAIRERLNAISLAITTLESNSQAPHHARIALAARQALDDIAILVTDDEMEEHARRPPADLLSERRLIRHQTKTTRTPPMASDFRR